MAVPKRKMSRSNTRSRRANWKATAVATTTCPQCKAPTQPHWRARRAAPTRAATTARPSAPSTRADPTPMAKGSASAGALTPLRPVSELLDHLVEVTGGPVDAALLRRALTHRSYAYEAGGLPHNERLEFLGDSVLGLVVTTTLYDAHPETSEGQLRQLRAAVVNMRALADVGRTLGLGDYVYLGRGEESTGGRDKDSILADTVEAVIGAVYQSAGIVAAGELVHHLVDPLLAQSATLGAGLDWKTSLQEITSRTASAPPSTP